MARRKKKVALLATTALCVLQRRRARLGFVTPHKQEVRSDTLTTAGLLYCF